ncbi:MAG: hypothetical protein JRG92_00195 [Deltaproteobacteria bacterium]|nr:hypothetical protein [Deltaproteobacteria bacterium]
MRRAVALLFPLSFLLACRTPMPAVPLPADDPRPHVLLESLRERAEGRTALRARAKLDLSSPDLRVSRPQRMAVARPLRLRVEVIGLFNQLAAILVTNGHVYQVYDARSAHLEEGIVSEGLLWRVARVDLSPSEAVDILLGAPLPASGLSTGSARIYADGGIAVDRHDAASVVRQRFVFDTRGQLAVMESFDVAGDLAWRARFSRYKKVPAPGGGDESFAFDVALDFPRVQAEAHLSFKRVDLVRSLPDDLFILELPDRSTRADPAGEETRL